MNSICGGALTGNYTATEALFDGTPKGKDRQGSSVIRHFRMGRRNEVLICVIYILSDEMIRTGVGWTSFLR